MDWNRRPIDSNSLTVEADPVLVRPKQLERLNQKPAKGVPEARLFLGR